MAKRHTLSVLEKLIQRFLADDLNRRALGLELPGLPHFFKAHTTKTAQNQIVCFATDRIGTFAALDFDTGPDNDVPFLTSSCLVKDVCQNKLLLLEVQSLQLHCAQVCFFLPPSRWPIFRLRIILLIRILDLLPQVLPQRGRQILFPDQL